MSTPRWMFLCNVVFCCFSAGLACAAAPASTAKFRPTHTVIEHRFQAFERSADDPGQLLRDKQSFEKWTDGPDPSQSAEADRTQRFEQYVARLKTNPRATTQFDRRAAGALAYQSHPASMETQRRWAVGVLDNP